MVQPGIIDTHLNATLDPAAYKAVAYAGVTSCIDMMGPVSAVTLLDGHPAHLAHINAYCRGYVDDVLSEFRRASALLEVHPEIVSESYVSDRSGGMVSFDGSGLVASHVMRRTLARFGYGCDRREVSLAIRDHVLSS